uniref:Uncharacterized protein n=1 Tax=Anguilla anguilla TaxID=7936 RepID=A0A0E9RAH5_ANGAN
MNFILQPNIQYSAKNPVHFMLTPTVTAEQMSLC